MLLVLVYVVARINGAIRINIDIEAHPFSVQAFSNKYSPFVQEIKRTGIKII